MPPTDNLYKFIFISGILIYLYALTFSVQQFKENWELTKKYKKDSIITAGLIVTNSLKIDLLSYQFQINGKHTLKELDINALDSLKLDSEQFEIVKEYLLLETKNKTNKFLLDETKDRAKEPAFYEKAARRISLTTFPLGIILVAIGFYYWYLRVHIPEMKLLKEVMKKHSLDKNEKTRSFNKEDTMFLISIFIACLLFIAPVIFLDLLTKL